MKKDMDDEMLRKKYGVQRDQLQNAVDRLREVLDMAPDAAGTVRDSAIQRFEICTDLSWKTIKTFLSLEHDVECASPKSCIREAFSVGIISEDDPFWLEMIHMRNAMSHVYNEQASEKVFQKLPDAFKRFQSLLDHLPEE